jgi:triosephosphate isomerase
VTVARRKFICGNWKMHKTAGEAAALIRELRTRLNTQVQIGIAPPFTALASAKAALQGSPIQLYAQNCHDQKQGAFTGEVSAPMLAELGCDGVILGHSERRQFFGETDAGVHKKLKAALEAQLHPIVCVGETLQEREANRTWEVVSTQLKGALHGIPVEQVAKITIAYEPVWAIGTGKVATTASSRTMRPSCSRSRTSMALWLVALR